MLCPEANRREIIALASLPGRPRLLLLFAGMAVLGAAAFLAGIGGSQPERAWAAYLVNFVFWTGLAAGTVLFSAMLTITHAGWGRPLKRLAEAPGAFLPVAFLLFLVLYCGRAWIFPWIAHPVPEKAAWLNVPFLFLRDGLGLLALTAAAFAILFFSVRRDVRMMVREAAQVPEARGEEREEAAAVVAANIYGILYAVVLSLLAFDLIMSLSPHWYSSLFGAYYFVGSFLTGLAALMILAGITVTTTGLGAFIRPRQFHDLGKLLLGFTVMTGDFFYTQFLVIWYGNLPEETEFVILRTRFAPWAPLAWTILVVCFVFPFLVLLVRRIKMRPIAMLVLCSIMLGGMWLERFLLIVPSLWQGAGLPIGLPELLITLGFFGIMALCVLLFLARYPLLPIGDPLFRPDPAGALDDGAKSTAKEGRR